MTEARDVEEIVGQLRVFSTSQGWHELARDVGLLIADWREKKAEIERLRSTPIGKSASEGTYYNMGYREGSENMRAKCEAIAQKTAEKAYISDLPGDLIGNEIGAAIAALKP